MSLLAENIKQIRLNSGLTQLEFGKKYGLSRFNVSSYEDGRAKPPVEVLITIAKEVNTTVEGLLESKMEAKELRLNSNEDTKNLEPDQKTQIKINVNRNPHYFPTSLFDDIVPDKELENLENDALERFEKVNLTGFSKKKEIEKEETLSPPPLKLESKEEFLGLQHVTLIKNGEDYESNHANSAWLAGLSQMYIPLYQNGEFRAFEDRDSWFVCRQVTNWFDISDGVHCFVLAKGRGLLHRKVYNEIKLKGEFLLSSLKESEPVITLGLRDVIEIWEVVVHINYGKPTINPSFNKLEEIVEDLKLEIFRLSR